MPHDLWLNPFCGGGTPCRLRTLWLVYGSQFSGRGHTHLLPRYHYGDLLPAPAPTHTPHPQLLYFGTYPLPRFVTANGSIHTAFCPLPCLAEPPPDDVIQPYLNWRFGLPFLYLTTSDYITPTRREHGGTAVRRYVPSCSLAAMQTQQPHSFPLFPSSVIRWFPAHSLCLPLRHACISLVFLTATACEPSHVLALLYVALPALHLAGCPGCPFWPCIAQQPVGGSAQQRCIVNGWRCILQLTAFNLTGHAVFGYCVGFWFPLPMVAGPPTALPRLDASPAAAAC